MFSYCKNNPVKFKEKAGEYSVTSFSYDYEEEDEYGTWGFSGTVYIYKGDEIKDISYFDNPDHRPSGYVNGRDVIVLDKRNQENPNMVVYNSYKIRDTNQQKEIISILLDYEKASPSNWKRTSESMLTEWKWHNKFALFSDSAKHTDFDLAEEGKNGWYFIEKAWNNSSIKQYIDNNPKPHWVLPV